MVASRRLAFLFWVKFSSTWWMFSSMNAVLVFICLSPPSHAATCIKSMYETLDGSQMRNLGLFCPVQELDDESLTILHYIHGAECLINHISCPLENGELRRRIRGVGDFILKVQDCAKRQSIGKKSKVKIHIK